MRELRRFKQALSEEECKYILKSAPRGVLALLGDENYPYALPMNFVYDSGIIYFHSALEGHKIDSIKNHPKASFCVLDEPIKEDNDWWYHIKSVIAFGKIEIITDETLRNKSLRLLGKKYFPDEAMIDEDMAKNAHRAAVIALSVEHISGKAVKEK